MRPAPAPTTRHGDRPRLHGQVVDGAGARVRDLRCLRRVAEVDPIRIGTDQRRVGTGAGIVAARDRRAFPGTSLEALEAPFAVAVVVAVALADIELIHPGIETDAEALQRNVGRRRRYSARYVLDQTCVEIKFTARSS